VRDEEREREEAEGEARQGALPGLGTVVVVEKREERGEGGEEWERRWGFK